MSNSVPFITPKYVIKPYMTTFATQFSILNRVWTLVLLTSTFFLITIAMWLFTFGVLSAACINEWPQTFNHVLSNIAIIFLALVSLSFNYTLIPLLHLISPTSNWSWFGSIQAFVPLIIPQVNFN